LGIGLGYSFVQQRVLNGTLQHQVLIFLGLVVIRVNAEKVASKKAPKPHIEVPLVTQQMDLSPQRHRHADSCANGGPIKGKSKVEVLTHLRSAFLMRVWAARAAFRWLIPLGKGAAVPSEADNNKV